jgi:excisionase family DNA binding protein
MFGQGEGVFGLSPVGQEAAGLPAQVALSGRGQTSILQVSPKTVSRWAKDGKLPFLRTLGGHRRYPAAEIRQHAEERWVQPTA